MMKSLKLLLFNTRHGTRIKSTAVSLRATLGRGVKIQHGTQVDKHSSVGAYSYLGNRCTVSAATIGRYCSIGDDVAIGLGEHDMGAISTSTLFQSDVFENLTRSPCTIGHDVWIGAQSLVLRGVTVGNGAVIGANSVVTRDVAPFEIVAGSPARPLRQRFDAAKAQAVAQSEWWLLDLDAARAAIRKLEQDT